MQAGALSEGSRADKTFALALGLLGAVALAQVAAVLLIYWARSRPPHVADTSAKAEEAATVAASGAVAEASAAPAEIAPVAPPHLRRLTKSKSTPAATGAPSVPEELLQVAKTLRQRGDTGNAIAKLQQAAALAPKNPEVLAELALTYESMQLFDRSNETWQRLKSLGAAAGALGELAEMKLRMGVPVAGIPGSTGQAQTASQPNDSSVIPDGSVFGISQVTQTTVPDPDAITHLTLRVGVKRQPNTAVDHTKVKIQVFFYDVVDNDQVVLTDADVSYEWITPGHNWVENDTEVLDVTYLRPKKTYPAPGTMLEPVPESVEKAKRDEKKKPREGGADLLPADESHNRQYLGYIVRVYYEEELQAVRADPTRLLNLFPPPFTAPPQ